MDLYDSNAKTADLKSSSHFLAKNVGFAHPVVQKKWQKLQLILQPFMNKKHFFFWTMHLFTKLQR
jgi:hypothetical protein